MLILGTNITHTTFSLSALKSGFSFSDSVSVGQKPEFTTLLTARGSEPPLCSSQNTEEKWIRTTHINIHTILYRLYSTIKREEKIQLSRDIFNKEAHMKTRGYLKF